MSTPEVHTVNGTMFLFPELPPEDSEATRRSRAERDAILEKARKVKRAKTKFTPPRGTRPPRPGNGEFNPEMGKPGSAVTVEIVVVDRKRWLTDEPATLFVVEREGCVMFPAPGGRVWVSLWDGRMPVDVRVDSEGRARIRATEDEYRDRFGEESDAA